MFIFFSLLQATLDHTISRLSLLFLQSPTSSHFLHPSYMLLASLSIHSTFPHKVLDLTTRFLNLSWLLLRKRIFHYLPYVGHPLKWYFTSIFHLNQIIVSLSCLFFGSIYNSTSFVLNIHGNFCSRRYKKIKY